MAFEPDQPGTSSGRFVPDAAPSAKPRDDPYTAKSLIGAATEPALAMATGAVAAPISGIAGLATSIANSLGFTNKTGGDVVRKVGGAMTYGPRTRGGQDALDVLSYPFEKISEGADAAGGWTTDVTGSPAAGAAVNTGIQGLAQIIVGKGLSKAAPTTGTPKNPKAGAASGAGFTLTPEEAGAGPIAKAVSGLAGEPKLARGAAEKNAAVAAEKIVQDVGLPKGAELTLDVLDKIRRTEGHAYERARDMGRVDMDGTFYTDLQRIAGDWAKAEIDFPRGAKGTVMDLVDNLRVTNADASSIVSKINTLRKDASRYFKTGDNEAGFAAQQASSALEEMLIRHGDNIGFPPDAVQGMRNARVRIAKTYAAQKALKGDNVIDPQVYARELAKGKPLTGEALTVAEFGRDFPRSGQTPRPGAATGAPTAWDAGLAMMHPGESTFMRLLGLLGRPGARSAMLSGPGQRMMISPPPMGHAAARLYAPGAFQQGQIPPPP